MNNNDLLSDNMEGIRKAVQARVEDETCSESNGSNEVSSAFVRQCLDANELGDGLLYAELMRHEFVYNNNSGYWLHWQGHHWEQDIMEKALAATEKVVDRYLEEVEVVTKEINWAIKKKDRESQARFEKIKESLYKRVFRLRTDRGRNACLKFARTNSNPLAISGDELDLHAWLLGCPNGVIDLRSGKFRAGRPEEYIFLTTSTAWSSIDEPAPTWEEALIEIFKGDRELIAYVHRLFGYAIIGQSNEHIFPVLWGQGRNGKGLIIDVLSHVLGVLAAPIQSEMLLSQRITKSAAGPSPDIMSLKGLRIAFASETDEGQRFSASKVKWLTGGDILVGRNPHDKYMVRFRATHLLFLLTNSKPHAPADDFAFWERMHLIPFSLSFVNREPVAPNERRAKKSLAEELKKEAPGILAWLVRGCLSYQKDGLNPPSAVLEATATYKRDEDLLADFIEDNCFLHEHARAQASELYERFTDWFERNISKRGYSQKKFGALLTKRFEKAKLKGVYYYLGIRLNED